MEKKSNFFKRIYDTSVFSHIVNSVAGWIKKQIQMSLLIGFLCAYPSNDELYSNSLVSNILGIIVHRIKKMCWAATKSLEESKIYSAFIRLRDRLLMINIQSYGTAFCFCGIISFVITAVKTGADISAVMASNSSWVSLMLILVGLATFLSKQPLCGAIHNSVIVSALLFRMLGIRKSQIYESDEKQESDTLLMAIIGSFVGALTYFIPVEYIALMVVAACVGTLIMCNPEIGVILCFFALPFVSTMQITLATVAVGFAFVVKLIRGKRYIKIDKMDICVMLFALVLIILGGIGSVNPVSSIKTVAMFTLFMLMYFVTANSLNTYKWVSKASVALVAAGALSALVGIYQNVMGFEASLIWIDTAMFSDIEARVIGTFDNPNVFGEFLIIVLPIAIALFATRKGFVKYMSLCSAIAMGAALIFTYSRGAWLGFALAIVVFLVLYDEIWAKIGVVGLAVSPFLVQFVPTSILNRVTSIGNVADTSTSYRVSIWQGTLRMLGDFWPSGIGSGSAAFLSVYPAYALSGASYAQHAHNLYFQIASELGIVGIAVFLCVVLYFFKMTLNTYRNINMWEIRSLAIAVAAGIGGYLIQSLTDYTWYNYRITLLFWMVLGLATSLYRCGYREWGTERENVGDYRLKGRIG